MKNNPAYFDIFQRNIGIVTTDEQLKLQNSTVLIAGIGGVGGPSALTLARLGIGRLIVADFDTYSVSNLNESISNRGVRPSVGRWNVG
jgi:tRNA A37 threonylcarbamoyladenosine dehydratase